MDGCTYVRTSHRMRDIIETKKNMKREKHIYTPTTFGQLRQSLACKKDISLWYGWIVVINSLDQTSNLVSPQFSQTYDRGIKKVSFSDNI